MDDKEDNCGGARVTGTDLTNVRITEIIDEQQAGKVGYAHVRRMLGEVAAGWALGKAAADRERPGMPG